MKRVSKSLWMTVFLLSLGMLWQCGHKANTKTVTAPPDLMPYAPENWDGEEDWSGNALPVQDIEP